jgi:hypothetical protein
VTSLKFEISGQVDIYSFWLQPVTSALKTDDGATRFDSPVEHQPTVGGAVRRHKVFGLGPGRTGTDSLKTALEELGFGPTYHMKEALFEEAGISTEGHFVTWHRAGVLAGRRTAGIQTDVRKPRTRPH